MSTASIDVGIDPETAFAVFTADIGTWWKRGTYYWNDPEKGLHLRFEPEVGGRLIEVHNAETGEGFDIGEVLAWEPGRRLVFTWRQGDWDATENTEVEVLFQPTDAGTRVSVEHRGWERVASATPDLAEGYSQDWAELLAFFGEQAAF